MANSISTTISDLRNMSSPTAGIIYQTPEYGGGNWYYDASDTTSLDNTGTILVSTSGNRFKRIGIGTTVYAEWFGVTADGTTDDYDSMNAAIDFLNGNGTLVLPKGTIYLNKPLGGGLALPDNAESLTITGQGGATIIKLSANVPRAFDLRGLNFTSSTVTYQNITLSNFTVDANNIDGLAMAPAVVATGNGVISGGAIVVPVASNAGYKTNGLAFLPYTNTGTSKGQIVYYETTPGVTNQIRLYQYTGTPTLLTGDVIQGACANHVIIGSLYDFGATGIANYNINADNILVEDVTAINVPTELPAAVGGVYNNTPTYRYSVSIATSGVPGNLPAFLSFTNITIRRVKCYGGAGGIQVQGSTNLVYHDAILLEDCYHDTLVTPTVQYGSVNYLVVNRGYGKTIKVIRCVGKNSADVGIETDGAITTIIEDCEIENSIGSGYFSANYCPPAETNAGPLKTTTTTSLASGGAVMPVGTVTVTLASIPSGVANSGFMLIDSELVAYKLAYGTNDVTIIRALNSIAQAAHAIGATVIFCQVDKQTVSYQNCTYLNNAVTSGLPGSGWYQTQPTGALPMPAPNLIIRDCKYTRVGAQIGVSGGEAINTFVFNQFTDINGFTIDISGINQASSANVSGAAMRFNNNNYNSGTGNIPQQRLALKNINLYVSGVLDSGTGNNRYNGIYVTSGDYFLDFDSLNIKLNFLNALSGQTFGLKLEPQSAGSTGVGGYYFGYGRNLAFTMTGDPLPYGIVSYQSNGYVSRLVFDNIDFSGIEFNATGSNGQYIPYTFLQPQNVYFTNVKHSATATVAFTNKQYHRVGLAANATSYTVNFSEEYIGVNNTTTACAIALPKVAVGNNNSYPNYAAELTIGDEAGAAATYNITITAFSGEKINGANTYVINTNYGWVKLKGIPGGWLVLK